MAINAQSQQKLKEMFVWLLFTAGFALAPLFVNWVVLRDSPDFEWFHLFRHGELYLVSGAFSADAVSRILRKRQPLGFSDFAIVAFCLYVLFGSTIEFGTAAHGLLDDQHPIAMKEPQAVRSIYYFVCMIVTGLGSIL